MDINEGPLATIRRYLRKREINARELPTLLKKVAKAKALHLKSARWTSAQFMVFKSSRGDCQPFQLSYLSNDPREFPEDSEQAEIVRKSGDFLPTGHSCVKSIEGAIKKLWKEYGRVVVVGLTESEDFMKDDALNERKRLSVTAGHANALVKFGAARRCPECHFGIPKYPGRYPGKCPRCKKGIPCTDEALSESLVPIVCVSGTKRIQEVIDGGRESHKPYLNDTTCSRSFTIPYDRVEESVGGADKLRVMLEGPADSGLYYRLEGPENPLLIFEFDDSRSRVHVFASEDPIKYLGADPRVEYVIEDHDATFEPPFLIESRTVRLPDNADQFLRTAIPKRLAKIGLPGMAWSGTPKLAKNRLGYYGHVYSGSNLMVPASYVFDLSKPNELTKFWTAEVTIRNHQGYGATKIAGGSGDTVAKALGNMKLMLDPTDLIPLKRRLRLGDLVTGKYYGVPFRGRVAKSQIINLDLPITAMGIERNSIYLQAPISFGSKQVYVKGKGKGSYIDAIVNESMNESESVRMFDIGSLGSSQQNPLSEAEGSQLHTFLDAEEARSAASSCGNLRRSLRWVGESRVWVLVQESNPGRALAVGEIEKLTESTAPRFNVITQNDRARRSKQQAVNHLHQRVAGEFFSEDKRASASRPRKPGEGATQVHGEYRIHVGQRQTRKPRKDVAKSLQNRWNAGKPGAQRARIKGSKEWHQSHDGMSYHRDQGRYLRGQAGKRQEAVRAKIAHVRDRIRHHGINEATGGTMGASGASQTTSYAPSYPDTPTQEDEFESMLRKLIAIEATDLLQDVEFDDATGAIYLFFDPMAQAEDVDEIISSVQQAQSAAQLIASPDMSIPGESVESAWWVVFLPGKEPAEPDPSIYSSEPDQHYSRVQMVKMSEPTDVDKITLNLDVDKIVKASAGK